jgi:hypothetical protein
MPDAMNYTASEYFLPRRRPARNGRLAGIKEDALAGLTPAQKRIVLLLLARVSEASYRRGAQQGAHIQAHRPKLLPDCLATWRYSIHADQSPWLDARRTEPAMQRLECEYRALLRHVGL